MGKASVLKELAEILSKPTGFTEYFRNAFRPGALEEYNRLVAAKKLKGKEPDLMPVESLDELLFAKNKVPGRDFKLSDFAYEDLAQALRAENPQRLRRVQSTPDAVTGRSFEKNWVGQHFDANGGTQMLNIIGKDKKVSPTQLGPKYQVSADIDPGSKGLFVSDHDANIAKGGFWADLLNNGQQLKNGRQLEEALRSHDIDWLMYPNVNEGANRALRGMTLSEPKLRSFTELLQQTQNPSIAVVNPRAIDVKGIARKKGGLIKMKECSGN